MSAVSDLPLLPPAASDGDPDPATWDSLPNDALHEILRFLTHPRDFATAERLERRMAHASRTDRQLWLDRLTREFYPYAARPIDTIPPPTLAAQLHFPPGRGRRLETHRDIYRERHWVRGAWRDALFEEDFYVGHVGWINAVKALPSGAIVSGGADHSLKIWGEDGETAATIDQHQSAIWAIDATDHVLLSTGFGGAVHVTDPASGRWLREIPALSGIPGVPMCPFHNAGTSCPIKTEGTGAGDVFATSFILGAVGMRDLRMPAVTTGAAAAHSTAAFTAAAAGGADKPAMVAILPKLAATGDRPRVYGCRFLGDHYLVTSGQGPTCIFDQRRAQGATTQGGRYHLVGEPVAMGPSVSPLARALRDGQPSARQEETYNFSMDLLGSRLATGSSLGTVDLWDIVGLASGKFSFPPPATDAAAAPADPAAPTSDADPDPGSFLLASQLHTVTQRWTKPRLIAPGVPESFPRSCTVFSVKLTEDERVASAGGEGTVCLYEYRPRARARGDPDSGDSIRDGRAEAAASDSSSAEAERSAEERVRAAVLGEGARRPFSLAKTCKIWPQASSRSVIRSYVESNRSPAFRRREAMEGSLMESRREDRDVEEEEEEVEEEEDEEDFDPDDPASYQTITAGAANRAPHSLDIGPHPGTLVFGGRTAVVHVLSAR